MGPAPRDPAHHRLGFEDRGGRRAPGPPVPPTPALVERWTQGAELNPPRPELFYGRTAEGYTDYPSLESVRAGV